MIRQDKPTAATPTVSIGMAAFNGEEYIRKALDSLLAQTYPDFELIISDDASTDGTEAICREYAARDSRIRYIRQSENRGVLSNYQFLLDEARGKYFMWAEDNDIWLPTYITECVEAMESDSSIGFVVTGIRTTSRYSFIFNRLYVTDFSFVTDNNPKNRVLTYSNMNNYTNKDNFCYAFWNQKIISKILSDIKNSSISKTLISGAMNEYALSLYKGGYIDRVLWHKTYRYLPPGHKLNPVIGVAAKVYLYFRPRKQSIHIRNSPMHHPEDWPSPMEHLNNIEVVLRLAGLDEEYIRKIIDNNRSWMTNVGEFNA